MRYSFLFGVSFSFNDMNIYDRNALILFIIGQIICIIYYLVYRYKWFKISKLVSEKTFWWDTHFDGIKFGIAKLYKLECFNFYYVLMDSNNKKNPKKHPDYNIWISTSKEKDMMT